MDYLSLLSLIPKLALFLLLLVGGAIVLEVFYLIRGKKAKKEEARQTPPPIPQDLKEVATPKLKFPQGLEKEEEPLAKTSSKKIFFLLMVLGLLIGLVVTLIAVSQKQEIRKKAALPPTKPSLPFSPTPPPLPQCLQIKVYKIVGENWEDWSEKLLRLRGGEEIKIAVVAQGSFNSVLFKVNGEMVGIGPSSKKNPFGEFYVDYTLPTNLSNFTVEAELL